MTELEQIKALVEEEHELRKSEVPDAARLQRVEELLDQCWDLLRQRRALRDAGGDPEAADARPADVVEHYQQ